MAVTIFPSLVYNSKTITLPDRPFEWFVDPWVPRVINSTLEGNTDTIMQPRVDVRVKMSFRMFTDTTFSGGRVKLDNWWQWAQRGGLSTLALDNTKTFSTTLSAAEAAGQSVISLTSTSGVVDGNNYVMISGPYYQLVTVSSHTSNTVTISSTLDNAHASGSKFRDQYLWGFYLRDPNMECPIKDLLNPPGGYEWSFDFVEAP